MTRTGTTGLAPTTGRVAGTARPAGANGAAHRAGAVREIPELPELAVDADLAAASDRAVAAELPVAADLLVKAGEDAWTAEELLEVQAELQAEVVRLSEELTEAASSFSRLVAAGGEGAGDDQVDHGAATLGREHEMTIANNARDLLEQSQRALVRLGSGAYGVCENCTGPIGKARLQAFPRVTLCLTCKARSERR